MNAICSLVYGSEVVQNWGVAQNWKNSFLLIAGGVAFGTLAGFIVCGSLLGPYFGRNTTVFQVHDSRIDFENNELILKTDTVLRNGPAFFDVGRWVVTLTHKPSNQSIALLTSYPSFQSDVTDAYPNFKLGENGFSYESDFAILRMEWPKIDFLVKAEMRASSDEWTKWYHLGGPKF